MAGLGAVAAARALPARAQQKRVPLVGYLWHAANEAEEAPYFGAIRDGFAKLGYVDGRTIRLVHRFPNETPALFQSMAAELVAMRPDVLMGGSIGAAYLKRATSEIPIVFMFVADPVGFGFVESLAKPGGNVTGLSNFGRDIGGKRLEVLKELVPGLRNVGFLINRTIPATRMYVEVMSEAATQLGLRLDTFEARSLDEMAPAFDAMVKAGMQAVTTEQGGTNFQAKELISKLALARRLPLCAYSRETFEPGALVAYGPDQIASCHRAAVYARKILNGARAADLPVEQPTKLELLVNAKTAAALGLTVPPTLLARADEVIE